MLLQAHLTRKIVNTIRVISPLKLPRIWQETLVVTLLLLATFILNLRMIQDGINAHADIKWHLTWLQHFSKQLAEGIWYPRWLAGTNYGYGSPSFVFQPPLVFYLGAGIKLIVSDVQDTIIILFSLALFLSGFNFYLFGRNKWGIFPAFAAALAYISAPYLSFDI